MGRHKRLHGPSETAGPATLVWLLLVRLLLGVQFLRVRQLLGVRLRAVLGVLRLLRRRLGQRRRRCGVERLPVRRLLRRR